MMTNIFAGNYFLGQVKKFGAHWAWCENRNLWRGCFKTKTAAIVAMMEYYEKQALFHANVWRHIQAGDIRQDR
jgi:hypothetical protein